MGASHDLLTTTQAAQLIGVSPSTITRWATQGRIPFDLGPGGERLFRLEDLEAVTIRPKKDPPEPDG